jgi:hypothetical protein
MRTAPRDNSRGAVVDSRIPNPERYPFADFLFLAAGFFAAAISMGTISPFGAPHPPFAGSFGCL